MNAAQNTISSPVKALRMKTLRVNFLHSLVLLVIGLWLCCAPMQVLYAGPSPANPNAVSPDPSTQPAPVPMPLDFTLGPKTGILIHVLLNGNTPATFVLDSGFSASCITKEMVKKLGMTPQPALNPDGKPVDTIVKNALAVFPAMQLGSISYASIGLVVVSEDQMHLNAITGQPVDGIIGNNILGFLPCFVDFAKNQVTFLYHLPVTGATLQPLGMQDASACPLTTNQNGGLYFTSVHISRTGANHTTNAGGGSDTDQSDLSGAFSGKLCQCQSTG